MSFEKKHSKELVKMQTEVSSKTNGGGVGTEIFNALLQDKVKDKKDWMLAVAKKASIRHEELIAECDKATKMQPDIKHYSSEGVIQHHYTEDAFKKKSEPFKKLEALSAAIDKIFTSGEVKDFEELEKLLK
jgi:hypothetical protein